MAKRRRTQNVIEIEDVEGFLEEFRGESDRAAAVLGAAYLNGCLKQQIANFLIDDSKRIGEILEGPLAPLGHFAARISASYCMGLISEDEYHDLQIIRTIRNEFAHKLHGLSFSDALVENKCAKLHLPREVPPWPHGPPGARNQFTVTVALLSLKLKVRTARLKRRRRPRKL